MAMCYLCDLCKQPHFMSKTPYGAELVCEADISQFDKLVIDWGQQDPREVCKHFEPKEG